MAQCMRSWIQIPSLQMKARHSLCMSVTPVVRGRDGWVLGAFWPASLAKMASIRFSKRSRLMGIRQRTTEEDNIPISSLASTRAHTGMYTFTRAHYARRKKKGKSLGELLTEKGFDIIQMCLFNSDQLWAPSFVGAPIKGPCLHSESLLQKTTLSNFLRIQSGKQYSEKSMDFCSDSYLLFLFC